jgi:HD-GYP domain-containing protein (c-di-GMP phosphodiesterase class II)
MGHAQRVCYIAMSLARSLELTERKQEAAYYAALLHDLGVPRASADLSQLIGINEDSLFAASPRKSPEELAAECPSTEIETVIAAFHHHCLWGGEEARRLGLPPEAAEAIAAGHEHWDGSGYPEGLAAHDIPLLGRIVCLADWAESIIAEERSSLTARRNLLPELESLVETVIDPHLAEPLRALCRDDRFWLGLYGNDLAHSLLAMKPPDNTRASRKGALHLAERFADVIDSKSPYTEGKSARVAALAQQLAEAVGFSPDHVFLIRLAALLHDVGQLGVPARIMGKPDILSLTEMQLMRRHPSYSRLILEGLRGFEEVALWVGAHHERPDGKGYPEMLTAELIPTESRIIAVANVHVALTSDRPHRPALSGKDAVKVLKGAAGTQLDPQLVRVFFSLL